MSSGKAWASAATCWSGSGTRKPAAAAAAKKAFLVNRVGDVGFAIAIFWIWTVVPDHDLSYDNVLGDGDARDRCRTRRCVGIALLLFWAATAKSRPGPALRLAARRDGRPDARLGPDPRRDDGHGRRLPDRPVDAAARPGPGGPGRRSRSSAALTALLSASIALTQTDLKRVMAYSTVSQLGYMFMALGAGVGDVAQLAVVAAMFHLFTHAFFKALLFLASGSVMHAMGGVIDMRRFGGLRHRMPFTCWTFAVGGLALSGIFPLAGFFSKDEILTALKSASHVESQAHGTGRPLYLAVYWVAVLTAFMTAFYTGRAFFLTFFGPEKLPSPDDPEAQDEAAAAHDDHGHDHGPRSRPRRAPFGHESPPVMIDPPDRSWPSARSLVGLHLRPGPRCSSITSSTRSGFEALGHLEHAHGFDWATAARRHARRRRWASA